MRDSTAEIAPGLRIHQSEAGVLIEASSVTVYLTVDNLPEAIRRLGLDTTRADGRNATIEVRDPDGPRRRISERPTSSGPITQPGPPFPREGRLVIEASTAMCMSWALPHTRTGRTQYNKARNLLMDLGEGTCAGFPFLVRDTAGSLTDAFRCAGRDHRRTGPRVSPGRVR